MTEPIKIPVSVTIGDLRGLDNIETRLRELRKAGVTDFRQALTQVVEEMKTAREQLWSAAGVAPRGGTGASTPLGSRPAVTPSSVEFWRRVAPGAAVQPVRVGPTYGPEPESPLQRAHALQFGAAPLGSSPPVSAQRHVQRAALRTASLQQAQATLMASQIFTQQTPLQAAHALQFTTPWSPLASARAGAQAQRIALRTAALHQAQTQAIAAQMLGQQTPLQAAHALQFTTPWSPLAAARAGVQAQQTATRRATMQQMQTQAIAAQLFARQTPLQQAHALQFTTPWSPLAQATAQMAAQRTATLQGGMRQAQLLSLVSQMGPPPPPGGWRPTWGGGGNWGERFGMGVENTVALGARGVLGGAGLLGRGIGAAYGAIQGPARAAVGAIAGIGIYQTITHAMQLYEQRGKAVLELGMRQNMQFATIGSTIDTLRSKYQVLAHDSIAALGAMGRVAGPAATRALLEPSARLGLGFGLTVPEAAEIGGRLSRVTTGRSPMAQILSAAQRTYGGRAFSERMEPAAQLEEATRMAMMHGGQGIQAPAGLYGGLLGFFGRMGEQYLLPGEASSAYGRFAAGLGPSGNPVIEAQRFLAVDDLRRRREARGQGSVIQRGRDTFDLATHVGRLAYMEQAGQEPELMEAYRQRALTLAQGNPQHEAFLYQQLVGGGQTSMTDTLRQLREAQAVGGFQNLPALDRGGTAAKEGEVGANLAVRAIQPEFVHALRQALAEARLEKVGEPLVTAADKLTMAMLGLIDGIGANGLTGSISELQKAVASLDDPTKKIASALLLASGSWPGMAAGAALGGTNMLDDMLNQQLRSYNNPLLNSIATFNEWLTRVTPNLFATTPSK
jgi:hypothetical protein